MDEIPRQYIEEKIYTAVDVWECECWKLYKIVLSVEEQLRESFPCKRPLRQDQLIEEINSSALFGYIRCNIKVPEHLRGKQASSPPNSNLTNLCRQDLGPLMQEYAEKKRLFSQLRWLFFSSSELTNGKNNTPLLLFFMEPGLVCTKIYHFVEYTPVNWFNIFVQTVIKPCRQGDQSPNSLVVAKLLNLLGQTDHMALNLCIVVANQLQSIRTIKKHMQQSTTKCSRDCGVSTINFRRQSLPNLKTNVKNE